MHILRHIAVCFFITATAFTLRAQEVSTGDVQLDKYLDLVRNKNVAMVVNHTSMVGNVHLVDTLIRLGVKVKCIFAPEHGFRGDHSAGETVSSGKDPRTGIPLVSLYGNNKKPQPAQLKGINYIIYDIQDVGARFYTYISTLHYVMEACAENKIPLLLLDRPNPNGYYVDGPLLDTAFRSFVGMHPVPIVHGMTIGEYAQMINGEKWLKKGVQCKLTIIRLKGWDHNTYWYPPVKPSPNLPTWQSVCLYPSLCLFEGTQVSLGRGTDKPFECFGAPWLKQGAHHFTPLSLKGVAEHPPFENQECNGFLLSEFCENFIQNSKSIYLDWLILCYKNAPDKEKFFNDFFDKLAGTDKLRKQIQQGLTADEIRQSWQPGLETFKKTRAKYLLYAEYQPVTPLKVRTK